MSNLITSALEGQSAASNPDAAKKSFFLDVIEGLSKSEKALEPKYFYDERGSQLFDEITQLEEYYPTRTETGILRRHAGELADIIGPEADLIEFGSGSSVKVRILLDALDGLRSYVPVDISAEHLLHAAEDLAEDYPNVTIIPVAADFTQRFDLPKEIKGGTYVGFFPGSTIGNFVPEQAVAFLKTAAETLGHGGTLIIGVDLKKDVNTLEAAYNDAKGVTAEFNLNVLERINRELGGNFQLDQFDHDAIYNEDAGRIEMHLRSTEDQTVRVNGHTFEFQEDETIHTESSYKYSVAEFHALAAEAGFGAVKVWTDPDDLFSLHYLQVGR